MPQVSNYITKTFSDLQTRFEIAISFPQGLRAIKANGSDAGKSFRCELYFSVELQYSGESTWNALAPIVIGGIYKDAFVKTQVYHGTTTNLVDFASLSNSFDQGRTFSIRIKRVTNQVDPEIEIEDPKYKYYDTSVLQSITGYKENTKPVTDPGDSQLAKTALSILATKQINGQIEGINALVQTYCLDWNGSSWVMNSTSNPASLFRYILTHPANPQRIKESEVASRIDLAKLQYWHTYCSTHNPAFKYNGVVGNTRSLLEVLRDVCAAGRASPALIDGKWSVNIDEPKSVIVQHFTPHNSWGFESVKALPKVPDALRIKFFNENADYKEDELSVYNYGKNASTAEIFESITLPGITDPLLVEDHGKWHFSQIKLRPEIYSLNTDIEYLVCNRGDRVKVTHDVPMWGTGSGRIKNRVINTAISSSTTGTSTCFDLDEILTIESTKNYTFRVRSVTGESNTRQLKKQFGVVSYSYSGTTVTVVLDTQDHPLQAGNTVNATVATAVNGTVTITEVNGNTIRYTKTGLTGSLANTNVTGNLALVTAQYSRIQLTTSFTYSQCQPLDLFLFGELNSESQDLVVLSIEPTAGAKSARLVLVDYGVTNTYNIFTQYKDLSVADFSTLITDTSKIVYENSLADYKPEIVTDKVNSSQIAQDPISPGVFVWGIYVPFTNPQDLTTSAEFVEAEYVKTTLSDPIGKYSQRVSVQTGNLILREVDVGATYRIRLRYITQNGIVGMWSGWSTHTVTGKEFPPENVVSFLHELVEYGVQFNWNNCQDLDYKSTILKSVPYSSTNLETAWNNPASVVLFDGPSNTWFWNNPATGQYKILARHQDLSGNLSSVSSVVTFDFTARSFTSITVNLSNDTHQIPTDENGNNPILNLSDTNIYVYQGSTLLKYDAVGTSNNRWKIVSVTGTNVTPGSIQAVVNSVTGDNYAVINNLTAIGNQDVGSIDFVISGKDNIGNDFSLTKTQGFIKQRSGSNPILYAIESSTPVVYKNSPDPQTVGNFSNIVVNGYRKIGTSPPNLYGWLGLTPYTGATAGTEQYYYQQISLTPTTTDTSTKWLVKLYDIEPNSITTPPLRSNTVLDQEEIQVVFEGETYNVEIESTNGNIFRPGQGSTTLLKARVFKNGIEVTDSLSASVFKWRRVSAIPRPAPNDDATWNTQYQSGYKQISINVDDVYARATFFCDINI